MMFADPKGVDADLVGKRRFNDDVAECLCLRLELTVGVEGDVAKGVETEL